MAYLRISAGVIVWAIHFAVVYGITALACARGAAALVPWTVGGATLVAGALALVVIARGFIKRREFESWLSAALAGFALIAIVWEAIPVLLVPLCD